MNFPSFAQLNLRWLSYLQANMLCSTDFYITYMLIKLIKDVDKQKFLNRCLTNLRFSDMVEMSFEKIYKHG